MKHLNQQSSADHIVEHLLAIDVDGDTMEYIINGVHLNCQILKQLLMKSSDFDINNLLEERGYSHTTQERKTEDKMFVLSAITLELFGFVNKDKREYLGAYGMAHFYDMCADIVNEMLDGLEYQKFLIDRNHFQNNATSLDWYYMDKAPSMFTDERIRRVAGF